MLGNANAYGSNSNLCITFEKINVYLSKIRLQPMSARGPGTMSADRVARSVALEQAYVYDVYEQLDDSCSCSKCGSKPWPKVQEFLDSLEAGSIVCDVGSGNGKYLNLNTSVFTIGGDKSTKLCEITRTTTDNEVILLDNLSLPYRDESLDGILSIAVIHHFTTTERRVCALRELARALRIGGRIIISVWAMEQNSRRFESQDVLVPVPWTTPSQQQHKLDTTTLDDAVLNNNDNNGATLMDYSCSMMADKADLHNYPSSKSSATYNTRRTRATNHTSSGSPVSTSTLSSPNETCYSFVRKAIQKLASSRTSSASSSNQTGRRPWFLDGWGNCAKELNPPGSSRPGPRYDPDGCECCGELLHVQDLPIELRRVDDEGIEQQQQQVVNIEERLIFPPSQLKLPERSHQSPNMSEATTVCTMTTNVSCDSSKSNSIKRLAKPKLVKQKQSICQDDPNMEEALDQHTDMLNVRKQRPVLKQRSLNEEHLMNSNARTLEKEKLKHHFHKQTSLNDELIYQQHINDHILGGGGDSSFFSSRRLHLIKTGFTNKLKTSTSNIEKAAAGSFKNGFVKILQNWNISTTLGQQQQQPQQKVDCCLELKQQAQRDCADGCERRLSKEEGSDSSKDSSLQSDTSVDSEDSFASVIFIPKSNSISPTLSPGTTTLSYSVPNSPKIKQSSCPTSPRIRQMPLSIYPPLTKQLSSPKPTTQDPTLILHQISKEHAPTHDPAAFTATTSLATKYSVQQIPKFNKKSPTEELQNKIQIRSVDGDKSKYPIVRHVSLYSSKPIVKPLPKLFSLELFNPEIDDKDSDSSAVSSPDSVESIVSVQHRKKHHLLRLNRCSSEQQQQQKLLQAAVDVANSLDDAVDKVIRSNKCDVNASDIQSVMERAFVSEPTQPPVVAAAEPWNKVECQKHLTNFADRLTEKLHLEISRYQQTQSEHTNKLDLLLGVTHKDPYIHRLSEELYDLSKLSAEIQKQNEYLAKLSVSDERVGCKYKCHKCRKSEAKCRCKQINDKSLSSGNISTNQRYCIKNNTVEVNVIKPAVKLESIESSKASSSNSMFGGQQSSIDSTDNSAYSGSTASLASCPEWKTQRNLLQAAERSASTETHGKLLTNSNKQVNASDTSCTSQESIPSDGGSTVGGEITYHRFYHVFRERELDQLIEKYVENLHIISSYYDHASWCIVAEKVHVWTI